MLRIRMSKKLTRLKTIFGVGALVMLPSVEAIATCVPEPYLGSVCATAANFCPQGYLPLAGQIQAVAGNEALFSLLGCKWGGNCSATFALPDMRGRSPMGTGAGPGLTTIQLGQSRGQEIQALGPNQLPTHNHSAAFTPSGGGGSDVTVTFEAYTSGAVTETPAAGNYISGGGGSTMFGAGGLGAELVELAGVTATGGGTVVVGNAGNGAAFSVEGPVTALTHCIATVGLYPPRP